MGNTAVLLLGPMRAGKTTTANYLAEKRYFKTYALADKLKQLHHTVTGSLTKDREWLQTFGASARLVFGEDFWVDRLLEQLEKDKPENLVVDDIRYENELFKLYEYSKKNYDRVCILIISVPMEVQITRGAEIHLLSHESEKYAHQLLNMSDYNPDTGIGYTKAIDRNVPIIDGTVRLSDFFESIEDRLRFEQYSKLRRYYGHLNTMDLSAWGEPEIETFELEEDVD